MPADRANPADYRRPRRALRNRLLLFDAFAMEWQSVRLPGNPAYPVCADR
ncbi:MAG: hypothetical protein PVI79_04665 [Gammaproteobacteria bacterium]